MNFTSAKWFRGVLLSIVYVLGVIGIVASGGGGSGGGSEDEVNVPPPPEPIISRELLDPTPGIGDRFGHFVLILANGNIVVSDVFDSSVAANNGAIHVYKPNSNSAFASIYGDEADDRIGSGGIFALSNNNFVILTLEDNIPGLLNAGSVRLVNGLTGAQIGSAIIPDVASDFVGSTIKTLPNNNFVIVAPFDDDGGIPDAGSVQQFDGASGQAVGIKIAGDNAGDIAGDVDSIVTVLVNGNYVVSSKFDDEGVVDAGSVRLIDGGTGLQIGGTLAGDTANDFLGSIGISALSNGNFVVASDVDDEGGQIDAGSVRLVDGTTGMQIGSTIAGDTAGDFASSNITTLGNGNYVISAPFDDGGGINNSGLVQLVNGNTGAPIGSAIAGDFPSDQFESKIAALANSNFGVVFPGDDVGGVVNSGAVLLINGTTGAQIGSTIGGDIIGDQLGSESITALANNNFVVTSQMDTEGGIVSAGSVRLVDGTTGAQIGSTIAGDNTSDSLGIGGITVLTNDNFVIASPMDDEGGVTDAGSVKLVNGVTGAQIGSGIVGDTTGDQLGLSDVAALTNDNFVIASATDNEGGIFEAGSVRLVNGVTGVQIGSPLTGETSSDQLGRDGIIPLINGNFVFISGFDNEGGVMSAGSLRLGDGATGMEIGNPIVGSSTNEVIQSTVTDTANGIFYVISLSLLNNNGFNDSGYVYLSTR